MPEYDFRCEGCGRRLVLHWRSVTAYAAATPTCPHCDSRDLTRLISAVGVTRATRDYASMSSGEMLSVLEGENPQEVRELQRQVHGEAE